MKNMHRHWTQAVPLPVLASRDDRLANPGCLRRLGAAWGGSFMLHPTAGHDLALDDGPWVAHQVSLWLENSSVTGRRYGRSHPLTALSKPVRGFDHHSCMSDAPRAMKGSTVETRIATTAFAVASLLAACVTLLTI